MGRSKAWEGLAYRSLESSWGAALELFTFAGAWAPDARSLHAGWGAWDGTRLAGALLLERAGGAALVHGPVVVPPPEASPESALDVATRLVSEALSHVEGARIGTLFARPQGLDRVWVRSGFIPVPEAQLPAALGGRPGPGLFGWRGGTALWSAAGRGGSRAVVTSDS